MASLGWLLNQDFAGSASGAAPVGPAVGSLLLLGVGRMWWLPMVWPWITGASYGGEMDLAIEIITYLSAIGAGALGFHGFNRYQDYQKRKHAPPPKPFVDDKVRPHIIGSVTGINRICPSSDKKKSPLRILSDRTRACDACLEGVK